MSAIKNKNLGPYEAFAQDKMDWDEGEGLDMELLGNLQGHIDYFSDTEQLIKGGIDQEEIADSTIDLQAAQGRVNLLQEKINQYQSTINELNRLVKKYNKKPKTK